MLCISLIFVICGCIQCSKTKFLTVAVQLMLLMQLRLLHWKKKEITLADDILFPIFSWLFPQELNSFKCLASNIQNQSVTIILAATIITYTTRHPPTITNFHKIGLNFTSNQKQFIGITTFRARFYNYDKTYMDQIFTIQTVVSFVLQSMIQLSVTEEKWKKYRYKFKFK